MWGRDTAVPHARAKEVTAHLFPEETEASDLWCQEILVMDGKGNHIKKLKDRVCALESKMLDTGGRVAPG